MDLYNSLLKPALFRMDPERAHNLAMVLLRRGLVRVRPYRSTALKQTLFGVEFENPIGLAAGFDKDAVGLNHWHRLGFGFVEVGTITYEPQPGNPQPRLFRLREDEALVNRFGFNNAGAQFAESTIASSKSKIPFGINLGKSKVTPLEEAAHDYESSFRLLQDFGAYATLNVSSPNTPGLRDLQTPEFLAELFGRLRGINGSKPLFLKVAPDMEFDQLDAIVKVAHDHRLTGIIATNTTTARKNLRSPFQEQPGGLSGAPLRETATLFLRHLRATCDRTMVLIGAGGIMNGDDLYERIRAGAHLCQIYTGWVYGGPMFVPRCLRRLDERMRQEGIADLSTLRSQ
jgi:dihydroorotate dehydrogenase